MTGSEAKWRRWSAILAVAILFVFSRTARGQEWFMLGEWDGYLESRVDWEEEESRVSGGSDRSFSRTRVDKQLGLRNTAVILHPGLATLSFGGVFGYSKEWASSDGTDDSTDTTLLGADLHATLLEAKPYTLSLFANRSDTTVSREFAGTTDIHAENWGGTLSLKQIFLPSTLGYRDEQMESESRLFGLASRRDEHRRILSYDGRRSGEQSDLAVRYEFIDLDDRVFPRSSYRTHDARLDHRLWFGTELDKTLQSNLSYFRREGTTDFSRLRADEDLRIEHSDTFWTDYQYTYNRSEQEAGTTNSHLGSFRLGHRLFESLTTDLLLSGALSTFPEGEQRVYGGRVDLDYTKRIAWGGNLLAGVAARYEVEDNQLETDEVLVFLEKHVAQFSAPFRLDQPRVVSDSIVVTDEAGKLFIQGRDYAVRFIGDFAEIEVILSGQITDGQILLVDYRYLVSRSIKFSTTNVTLRVGLDYNWIHPYYSYESIRQDLLSGTDGTFLDDITSHTGGVRFRWQGEKLGGSLDNEFTKYTSTRLAYDGLSFGQSLQFAPYPRVTLSLNLNEDFFDYTIPKRETTSGRARATLAWRPWSSLHLEGVVGARVWNDTLGPEETNFEAGLRARWTLGKLELSPSLQYNATRRNDSELDRFRMLIQIIRRF